MGQTPPSKRQGRTPAKKRILIINCFFDDSRQSVGRTNKVPWGMGAAFLAGACSRELCEIRLHNEVHSGPLTDPELLGWPDMLVLTGLTNSLDRMLHLTAYARTGNERVIVVAGGPVVRTFPLLAKRYFDYCCEGDVEQLQDVIAEAFGREFVSEEMVPRFDLAYWSRWMNYAETTRYCNFRCSYCALTGEGRGYQKYSLDTIRRQIFSMDKRHFLVFLDNNFYGNDRANFLARIGLLRELREAGRLENWGALLTGDFFYKDENLKLAREAGCRILFSGVESFDSKWLRDVNKIQNLRSPQEQMITKCLEAGIFFAYGLMLDVTARTIEDVRAELDFVTGNPAITLPSYVTLPIPIPGTPFFNDQVRNKSILPDVKLRDLDGSTLVMRPMDELGKVLEFVRDMMSLRGYQRRVARHTWEFFKRYRSTLSAGQMTFAIANAGLLCAYALTTAPLRLDAPTAGGRGRTHLGSTEQLDPAYTPSSRIASRYESYFRPTMLTDAQGNLTEEMTLSGMRTLGAPAAKVSGVTLPRALAVNTATLDAEPASGL